MIIFKRFKNNDSLKIGLAYKMTSTNSNSQKNFLLGLSDPDKLFFGTAVLPFWGLIACSQTAASISRFQMMFPRFCRGDFSV